MMKRARVVLALAPFALLAGCGGVAGTGGGSPTPGVTVTATAPPRSPLPPASPSALPSRAGELPPPTSTQEIEVKRSADRQVTVTGVRFAKHTGFDRVVVDLKEGLPGYTVRWVPKLVQDGSGAPIDVKGGAYLQLSMHPARAHDEAGSPTWAGGPVFPANLGNTRSVVKTGDFEGVVGVGLALGRKAPFRVFEQKNPYRLVVDVAH